MLQASQISKEFAGRVLFKDVNFSLDSKEKLGLVGRNGSGKSTLFKILLRELAPDSGSIIFPKNYSIGYLEQHLKFTEDSVLKEAMLALPIEIKDEKYIAEKILSGLGFSQEDFEKNPKDFSGGFQIRLNLAKVLIKKPNLLLLDEPTNYLDIIGLRWLEGFLRKYDGEVVLICHDRGFMDKVVTSVAGIHRQKLYKYKGGTDNYYQKIWEEEELYEATRMNQEKKVKKIEEFVTKFRAKARQASLAQSRMKMLDKMSVLDKLEKIEDMAFYFHYKECPAKTLLKANQVSFKYTDEYLFSNLNFSIDKGDRIAIVGQNGKGKSTLLNILAGELDFEGEIQKHSSLAIGHFGQTNISRLSNEMTIEEEIRSSNLDLPHEKVRSIAGGMQFSGDEAKKKIRVLSGGEKSRVMLAKILAKSCNLLLLDEPTNHLDQESIEVLIEEIENFEGAAVVVTHSEYLLNQFPNKIIYFKDGSAQTFLGNYQEFLEKIGWNDSDGPVIEKKSFKDVKRLKSELVIERAKKTKPFKDKIETIESRIMKLEAENNESEDIFLKETNGQKISEHSMRVKKNNLEIENLFNDLTVESEKLNIILKEYEDKIKSLEN
jgi:ATP-binding cassette subfamily F protein 3